MTERRARGALVVTGAGSGMGRGAVERGLQRYDIVLALDRDPAALDALGAEMPSDLVQRFLAVACDVGDRDAVATAVTQLADGGHMPAALFNFAGVSDFSPATSTAPEAWARQLSVNLTGTFNTCQVVGALMVGAGRGAIVNVASTAGLFGVPGMAAYTAAKHGVVGLTRALAVEFGRAGVRVNCICPGATLTPMLRSTSEEYRAERVRRVPLGRLGEPEEQVSVALFLASDAASYVTGAIIPVDGGVSAMAPGTAESAIHA